MEEVKVDYKRVTNKMIFEDNILTLDAPFEIDDVK
jgi:hypothetical protein